MDERGPSSPCLNICSLDERGVCRGCYRTLAEIAGWMRMSAADQWATVGRALKAYSNWPTYPQLYVNGELVGGCDIVTEMYRSGELKTLLQEAGAIA
jgi:predicted Fe-S protein YdhL (DUF1289 family)